MRYRGAILSVMLALAVSPVVAADPPAVTVVPDGASADLTFTVPADAAFLARITPPPTWAAGDLPEGRLIFNGVRGRAYTVEVTLFRYDEIKKKPTVSVKSYAVNFGPAKPGPVNPPTPDEPPAPVNALSAKLQLAFTQDGGGPADLAAFKKVCEDAATAAKDPALTGKFELINRINARALVTVGRGKMLKTWDVIGDYLDGKLSVTDAALTDDVRKAYVAAYGDVAAALAGIK